jgi:uncharacterized membrane protein
MFDHTSRKLEVKRVARWHRAAALALGLLLTLFLAATWYIGYSVLRAAVVSVLGVGFFFFLMRAFASAKRSDLESSLHSHLIQQGLQSTDAPRDAGDD